MGNSEAYSIIKALIEKNLLVIHRPGFVEWLDRLQSKGEILEKEIDDLLQLTDQLQIYDVPRSEVICIEEIPFFEWVQAHKYLIDTYLGIGQSTARYWQTGYQS